MSDKKWNNVLKNKKKSANVMERRRNQYRNIAKKISLNLPILGVKPS